MTPRVLIEVCVGSLVDAESASRAGAHRLELCSALELGGLTPSIGHIEQVVGDLGLPVVVMVRPRSGGFCYNNGEFHAMLRDAEAALNAGASGIVFGCLSAAGEVDIRQTKELVDLAGDRTTVFHRAFDFVGAKTVTLDLLADIGVTRVLTAGGAGTAIEGAQMLRELKERSAGRIELLPGGGIKSANVKELLSISGCDQVHVGAATSIRDPSVSCTEAASLSDVTRIAAGELRTVDHEVVANIAQAVSSVVK